MIRERIIGKGKGARTTTQILSAVASIKDAMFFVLVPAYIEVNDGADESDSSLNQELLRRVGRLLASGTYADCPECERILLVGAKNPYPFVFFHELLKEMKRHGA